MRNGTPYYDLFVGSSNLTGAALNTQREWNLKVSSLTNGELVAQVRDEIDSEIADSKPLTEEWIKQYEEDFKKYAPPRRDILKSLEGREIQPNAMQKEALASLKKLREQGEHRAIIVSATGTGKTYLSAFDVREYRPLAHAVHRPAADDPQSGDEILPKSARLSAIRAGTVYRHQQTTGSALRVRHGADHAPAGGTGAIRL